MNGPAAVEAWPRAAAAPELFAAEMHVWRVPLDISAAAMVRAAGCLDRAEQARAAAYRFERHRRRFVACRAAQRGILGKYLDVAPREISFDYSPLGKPRLAARWQAAELEFNVTNSGEWALVSVTRGQPHGVDVEHVARRCDHAALAARYFAPEERAALAGLPSEDRRAGFFRCWTRKEAVLKATGTGLTFPLDRFVVALTADEPPRLHSIEGCPQRAARWSLVSFEPGAGYQAALAWEGSALGEMRTFTWMEDGKRED